MPIARSLLQLHLLSTRIYHHKSMQWLSELLSPRLLPCPSEPLLLPVPEPLLIVDHETAVLAATVAESAVAAVAAAAAAAAAAAVAVAVAAAVVAAAAVVWPTWVRCSQWGSRH